MSTEPDSFSQYLVIFVDILGSQNRTDFQEMYQINKIFYDEFEQNQKNDKSHTVYERKIFTFSDCAYIFYHFKDGTSDERKDLGKLFTVALCNCETLFLRLITERIVFRGGIFYGDAYVDPHRNMFFGPAVNTAYNLESTIAMHPRIIIDNFVAKTTIENISQVKDIMLTKTPQYIPFVGMGLIPQMPETGDGIVEKDVDGQYIFNYLYLPENNIASPNCYSSCEEFLNNLRQYCHEQINKNDTYRIIDKYYYLLRFSRSKLDNLLINTCCYNE